MCDLPSTCRLCGSPCVGDLHDECADADAELRARYANDDGGCFDDRDEPIEEVDDREPDPKAYEHGIGAGAGSY